MSVRQVVMLIVDKIHTGNDPIRHLDDGHGDGSGKKP
jgi:hypothetical protein